MSAEPRYRPSCRQQGPAKRVWRCRELRHAVAWAANNTLPVLLRELALSTYCLLRAPSRNHHA